MHQQDEVSLIVKDGVSMASSLEVAMRFGKKHFHVLRSIRDLECSEEFRQSNFGLTSCLNGQGKAQPMCEITRDGFTILAMSFTGKEAVRWKEAYIKAFNDMERALRAPASPGRFNATAQESVRLLPEIQGLSPRKRLVTQIARTGAFSEDCVSLLSSIFGLLDTLENERSPILRLFSKGVVKPLLIELSKAHFLQREDMEGLCVLVPMAHDREQEVQEHEGSYYLYLQAVQVGLTSAASEVNQPVTECLRSVINAEFERKARGDERKTQQKREFQRRIEEQTAREEKEKQEQQEHMRIDRPEDVDRWICILNSPGFYGNYPERPIQDPPLSFKEVTQIGESRSKPNVTDSNPGRMMLSPEDRLRLSKSAIFLWMLLKVAARDKTRVLNHQFRFRIGGDVAHFKRTRKELVDAGLLLPFRQNHHDYVLI